MYFFSLTQENNTNRASYGCLLNISDWSVTLSTPLKKI